MAASESLVAVIDVDQLAAVVKNKLDKVLIIDSRSFLEFNTCHVTHAVNVCCSKLVKRRLQQDKVSVKDFLMSTCHVIAEESYDVIVYDQSSSDFLSVSPDSFVFVLLKKLACVFNTVNLLQGGFLEFQAKYLHMCEDKTRKCAPLVSLSQPCLPITNTGPTRILPFLYLGSQYDAMNKELLMDHNIMYELNVSAACPKPDFISDGHFMRIPVNDNYSEKLLPHFPMAFQFVDKVRESNSCVLIHCLAGISRSPTVAIAYIMRYLHMSSDDAYRYVKSKRATISPNFNFLGQLLEYEHQLRKECVLDHPCHVPTSSGNGVGHKRPASAKRVLPKMDLCLPVPCENVDASPFSVVPKKRAESSGEQSPTSALSKLSFSSADADVDSKEENRSKVFAPEKSKRINSVRKSHSTSNIWTVNNSLWFSERRLSFDASLCSECGNRHHLSQTTPSKTKPTSATKKNVNFEGVEGIPTSSLDCISFMPCRTSVRATEMKSSKSETKSRCDEKETVRTSNALFENVLCDSHRFAKHLNCEESTDFRLAGQLTVTSRESSPRPTSISVSPLTCTQSSKDMEDDEGIDVKKEEDDSDLEKKTISECEGSTMALHATSTSITGIKTREPIENLESSYDSGVFPSPTQFEFGEIFHTSKKFERNWLASYEEESEDVAMETDCYFSMVNHEENHVCTNVNIEIESTRPVSAPDKSSVAPATVATQTSGIPHESHTHGMRHVGHKEDRLYRAHSCPGILGWMHCTTSTSETPRRSEWGSERSQFRKLKLSSVEREMRLHYRYSCGSLDLMQEAKSWSFDSCPDFGLYCRWQKDGNSRGRRSSDQSSLSPTFHAFLQNSGIIQVS